MENRNRGTDAINEKLLTSSPFLADRGNYL